MKSLRRITPQRAKPFIAKAAPRGFEAFTAGLKDIGDIVVFSKALFGPHFLTPGYLRRQLRHGHFLAFGLKDRRGRIAAFAAIECHAGQRRLYIVEIGVDPARRGKGLALWLMTKMEALARANGYCYIASHVVAKNKASYGLHRAFGMEAVRLIPEYFHDGADSWYMRKTLS